MNRSSWFCRLALLVGAAGPLGGCYVWREVPPEAMAPGRQVRVTMEPAEAARQQPALGRLTQVVEGEIVAGGATDVLGLTVASRPAAAAGGPAFNVYIELPRSAVQRLETREFSFGRTALLAGGSVAVVVTALSINGGGTEGGPEGPGPNSRVRVPIFTFPIR